MINAAKKWESGKFIIAGPQFPENIKWPANIERIEHLSPEYHRRFYNSQRYTLNVTRAEMVKFGFSPSVRLFEAAACQVPIISDFWPGIDTILEPGKEILISESPKNTLEYLQEIDDITRRQIAHNAWRKILDSHTGEQRAIELENYILELKRNKVEMTNPN
jgi:spore maturation protein CgeB